MSLLDRRWPSLVLTFVAAGCSDNPGYRYTAPVVVDQPAPFVRLELPAEAYRRTSQPNLADLRLVDGRGEPVPYALLDPLEAVERVERATEATLYPLPARRGADGSWSSPVEVVVAADRIEVRQRGGPPGPAEQKPGGWLIDLGERSADEPPPDRVRLRWAGAEEFTASFEIETSSDLRRWSAAGSGQLMSLNSPGGALTQPAIDLPPSTGRFVRLVWAEPSQAPALVGASGVTAWHRSITLESAKEVVSTPQGVAQDSALDFDLGGAIPIVSVALGLGPGTRVAPVRLQGRVDPGEPWRELGRTVFYRLERSGNVASVSPRFPVASRVRFVRIMLDPRAARLDPASTTLTVWAQLGALVFANQGQPPFTLHAGSSDPAPAALPAGMLVPDLERERPRFGRATVGAWSEVESVARAAAGRERIARARPWLLWTVLVVGVTGLAFMVWRLVRGTPAS